MAKRYGQRPSSILPTGLFNNEEDAMSFDFNVMLIGMNAEMKAHDNRPKSGTVASRGDAMSAARRARAMADEIWGMT